jgi:hypothetical protein
VLCSIVSVFTKRMQSGHMAGFCKHLSPIIQHFCFVSGVNRSPPDLLGRLIDGRKCV